MLLLTAKLFSGATVLWFPRQQADVGISCLLIRNVLTLILLGSTTQWNAFRVSYVLLNRLKPNDPYMGRTAPLTSKRCILYIYSTNIGTEYFKHALYSPFLLFKMQFVS